MSWRAREPHGLPELPSLTPRTLRRFDLLEGTSSAVRVLREELGFRRTARLAVAAAVRSFRADPLAPLPKATTPREKMARSQLKSVLVLFDALMHDLALGEARSLSIVRRVMHASGGRFVARFQPEIPERAWRASSAADRLAYARELVRRLFNATVDNVRTDAESLSFDVVGCLFADLLRTLGRERLSPLFCEVDDAFVARPGSRLSLVRLHTIAQGASTCDFRFEFSRANSRP